MIIYFVTDPINDCCIIFSWLFDSWTCNITNIWKKKNHSQLRFLKDSKRKFISNSNMSTKFFQSCKVSLAFPEKWFCICRPNLALWSIESIFNHWKISFRLLQSSKQIYRKPQYREKVFEEFQGLPSFLRKMILYSSTKFGIIKPCTDIPWLRGFDLGFWLTSNQIYRKIQYAEKVFWKFQRLPHFPREMVLYSSGFSLLLAFNRTKDLI